MIHKKQYLKEESCLEIENKALIERMINLK